MELDCCGRFLAGIGFYLDALSLVMVLVVGLISFLIHLYSTRFMSGDEDYANMNTFASARCAY